MDYKNDTNSDDDFDCSNSYGDNYNNNSNSGYNGNGRNTNGMSKAELRKTNKPIMEKRRRARINHCLNELKSLILEAMKKDPARHTKLEKADILEMTVKHLQSVQRQQLNMAIQTDPSVIHKFKTGFVECADEVNRYVSQLDGVDAGVRQRLTNHLNNCATGLEQIGSMTNFNNGYRGQMGANSFLPNTLSSASVSTPAAAALFPPLPQDLNNNNNNSSNASTPIQMGGVQLIPSRLPSGEFALIMPNSNSNSTNNNTTSPFATWPHVSAAGNATTTSATQLPGNISGAPQINDFAANFQRLSAFSKPQMPALKLPGSNHQTNNTNFNTSTHVTAFHQPQNNLHHNSTTTTSPPLSPISSVSSHGGDDSSIMHTSSDFPASRPATPPHEGISSQHNFSGVFSTPSSAESSLSLSRSSIHLQQQQVSSTSGSSSDLNTSLKRPLTETTAVDSSDSSDEPSSKKFAASLAAAVAQGEDPDSMWRPW